MVYHSHMLEHLPGWQAEPFMAECARVLKPGGVLRVAIPDLETICRLYLESLSGALNGDKAAEHRYDWMLIELIDQISRVESGGEMARYWRAVPPEGEGFVVERVGDIAASVMAAAKEGRLPPAPPRHVVPPEEVARFRSQGEVHQWMYDRFSLGRLMQRVGLEGARVVDATESGHPGYARFRLDADQSGQVRKPDSLFMEAVRR
jgi:SAM-dependent methyltransferase